MTKHDFPTPEVREHIAAAVRLNVPPEVAAEAAGVGTGAFWRWMTRGQEDEEGPHREFYLAIHRAETERQKLTLAEIIQIGRGGQVTKRRTTTTTRKNGDQVETIDETITPPHWTALAWLLERRWPQWWGRNATDNDNSTASDGELHELLLEFAQVAQASDGDFGQKENPRIEGPGNGPTLPRLPGPVCEPLEAQPASDADRPKARRAGRRKAPPPDHPGAAEAR